MFSESTIKKHVVYMSPVINRIKINLELVIFLNIIDTWLYPSVIRKTD